MPPRMTPWNQVTIIGAGLVGGSLGLALKRAGLARSVVAIGRRKESLDAAIACGAADRATLDPAGGVKGSDLVVLATPIGCFEPILRLAAPALDPGAVVIDVGSTKADVVRTLEPLVPEGRWFLGCHPIAGSEQRGVAAARADLFAAASCVVTPGPRTPADVLERVIGTWESLGMTVHTMPPEVHDRLLAEVSHLPHVAAAALVHAISGESETLAGPGWSDTTRVASGDAALWRDILLSNAEETAAALERFQGVLAAFRAAIRNRDAGRLQAMLDEAKRRRDRIIAERNQRH